MLTRTSPQEAAADEAGKPFNMVARMMQYHELNRAAQYVLHAITRSLNDGILILKFPGVPQQKQSRR